MVYLLVTKKGFQPSFFKQTKVQKNTVCVLNTLIYIKNLWSKAHFLVSFSNHLLQLTKLLFKHFVEFFHRNHFVIQSSFSFQSSSQLAFNSAVY